MEGLICCKNIVRFVEDSSTFGHCEKLTDDQKRVYIEDMSKKGFVPNYEYDCFILAGYGAYMGTTTLDNFENSFYWNYFKNIGYQLVIGPSPYDGVSESYGVFCANYEELFQKNDNDLNQDSENKEVGVGLLKVLACLFKHK